VAKAYSLNVNWGDILCDRQTDRQTDNIVMPIALCVGMYSGRGVFSKRELG